MKSTRGRDEIITDDFFDGQLEVTFTQNQRPTKEHPNVSYQFSRHQRLQTGDSLSTTAAVGKTIIDENGLVTLKYNEAYFSGNKEVNDASFAQLRDGIHRRRFSNTSGVGQTT